MITVVLADDDFLVLEVLRESIPWKEYGMEVIAAVENGKRALAVCEDKRPDILFADIRMPFLTGLEVAVSLQEAGISTRVVLISGVQDFNYARTALNIQAAGYILKPIRLQEIEEVLKKIRASINLERNRKSVFDRLKNQLDESIPLLREKFLHNLLLGIRPDSEDLEKKLGFFHLPLSAREETVAAAACMDDYAALTEGKEERYKQFLNFSVRNIIEEIFENHHAGTCISMGDNEIAMVFGRSCCTDAAMERIFDEIAELLAKFDGITLSTGVGNPVSGLENIDLSYNNALRALGHRFYTGKGSVIRIGDIVNAQAIDQLGDKENTSAWNSLQKELLSAVKLGDAQKLAALLEEYFGVLSKAAVFSNDYARSVCAELIISAYKEIYETEQDVQSIFPQYISSLQAVLKADTIFEMKNSTFSILEHIAEYFKLKFYRRSGALVKRIKEIAAKHFTENISLVDIAGEVYLSPNYICSVFKKETGETINEYLIGLKIKSAQEMLRSSKMKICDIAEKLGYENPHYFSYSFKKYTGQTPQQYRMGNAS